MKKIMILLTLALMGCNAKAQCSFVKITDTSIVYTNSWYGVKSTTEYFFKKKDFDKARKYAQLANLPYMGLNDEAKTKMNELSRYILYTKSL